MSKKSESDPQRIVGILGYTYLKTLLSKIAEVEFSSNKVVNKQEGSCNLILHHGDNGFNSKQTMQILQTYGRMDIHNVIMS